MARLRRFTGASAAVTSGGCLTGLPLNCDRKRKLGLFCLVSMTMVVFGIAIGFAFPPVALVLGLPASKVLTVRFFVATVSAGALVGMAGGLLVRVVLRPRLGLLAKRMEEIAEVVTGASESSIDWAGLTETARVTIDTPDDLGRAAEAFNGLVGSLAQARETQAALDSISAVLARNIDLGQLASEAAADMVQHFGLLAGSVVVTDGNRLDVAASSGPWEDRIGGALVLARSCLEADVSPRWRPCPKGEGETRAGSPSRALTIPLVASGAQVGAFVGFGTPPASGASAGRPEEEVLRLASLVQTPLAVSIGNALAHDRLVWLAGRDNLTGLHNRNAGLERLDQEMQRAQRSGESLAVAMIDVDHFKSVNDTLGHLGGDRALSAVAVAVSSKLRASDLLARYGGDELMAVLPGARPEDLAGFGARICEAVAGLQVQDAQEHKFMTLTVSVGLACTSGAGPATAQELVDAADRSLYEAKRGGRNRAHAICDGSAGPDAGDVEPDASTLPDGARGLDQAQACGEHVEVVPVAEVGFGRAEALASLTDEN